MTAPSVPLQPVPQTGDIDLTGRGPTPAPQPPTKPASIDEYLAEQANDAMRQGADPHIVTMHLGQMVAHLNDNPRVRSDANGAIAQGADPLLIARDISDRSAQDAPRYYQGGQARAGLIQAALHGALGGFSEKIEAGTDALGDAIDDKVAGSGDFTGTLARAYDTNLNARRAALAKFQQDHPIASGISEAVGSIPLATVLGGPTSELNEVGLLGKLAAGAKTGAKIGAFYGLGDADYGQGLGNAAEDAASGAAKGAAVGAIAAPATDATIGLGRKIVGATGLPDAISRVAGRLAETASSDAPAALTSSLKTPLETLSNAIGARGEASRAVGRRMQMDQTGGFTPTPLPPSVPPLAIDEAGPNVEGLAKNILNRPGPGRTILDAALRNRQAGMRHAVSQALDDGSGTTSADGEALLDKLATETGAIDANPQRPTMTQALGAWQTELGGSLGNALSALKDFVDQRSAEADALYGQARNETQGQPVDSPTLDAIKKTPAGQAALAWARAQKSNRMSPMAAGPAVPPTPDGFSDEQWANVLKTMQERGLPLPSAESEELPDPETIHYAKQYLGQLAKLGVHDGTQGTMATQAHGVLGLWGQLKDELPDSWQAADAAYAAKSRVINALNLGRDLMRTQLNPAGTGRALNKSLDAVTDQLGDMAPQERDAFRIGAQSSVTDYLRSGGSVSRLAAQLKDPTSAMSRRFVLATNDPTTPERMAAQLATPDGQLTPTSQAARRGFDVLQVGTSKLPPDKTFTVLNSDLANMTPAERTAFQSAAAHAVRGQWQNARSATASPGTVLATSPDRVQQVGYAFPDQQSAENFQNTVKGWDQVQAQNARVRPRSDTFANSAEDAERMVPAGVVSNALRGNVGAAVGGLVGRTLQDGGKQSSQAVDAEIANILSQPKSGSLTDALQAALMRQRWARVLQAAGVATGDQQVGGSPAQPPTR